MIKIIEMDRAEDLQNKVNEFNTHTPCFATQTHVTYYGPNNNDILYTAVLFYNEVRK